MDTKKIGKFISENRKRKGLTQEQLGNILGVSNKTISRWENGNYMPDLSLLIPLSETLDISLNELLNGKYITEDKIMETTEKSLKNTINYSKNMLVQEKRKVSIGIMIFGAFLCFLCICDIRYKRLVLYLLYCRYYSICLWVIKRVEEK